MISPYYLNCNLLKVVTDVPITFHSRSIMAKHCEHVSSLKDAAHTDNHTFQHYSEMNVDRWVIWVEYVVMLIFGHT